MKLGPRNNFAWRRDYQAKDSSLPTSFLDNSTLRSLTAAKRLTPWDENRCFLLDPRVQDTKKDPNRSWGLLIILTGRRAYLARDYSLTTSAAEKLNCCVRDGNRCFLLAMITRKPSSAKSA